MNCKTAIILKKEILIYWRLYNGYKSIKTIKLTCKNVPPKYFFRVKALKDLLFVFLLSSINLILKVNLIKPLTWKILFNSLNIL